jgi:hypothetical protein
MVDWENAKIRKRKQKQNGGLGEGKCEDLADISVHTFKIKKES